MLDKHTITDSLCYPTNNSTKQVTVTMTLLTVCSLLVLLALLGGPAAARRLHLGGCSVSVHTHELRRYHGELRPHAVGEDTHLGVRLLKSQVIKNVKEGETCCFLRLLLRFYVERVFSGPSTGQPHHQRSTSAIANAFLSINRELRHCNCQCREETQTTMDSVLAEFIQMDRKQAGLKAVAELDTLLDWLDSLSRTTHAHHRASGQRRR